jgi:hypothetical protein
LRWWLVESGQLLHNQLAKIYHPCELAAIKEGLRKRDLQAIATLQPIQIGAQSPVAEVENFLRSTQQRWPWRNRKSIT